MPKNPAKAEALGAMSSIEIQMASIDAELEELLDEEEKEKCEQDLYYYLASAWKHFDPVPFIDSWHIQAIAEHLSALYTGEIKDLIVNIPPAHGKSSLISIGFPTWLWIKDATSRIITASYGADLSMRDAVKSRRLLMTPWFQKKWGDKFKLTSDQNQKSLYENDQGGYRFATSVGGGLTGWRYRFLLTDDPLKALDANSEVKLNECIDWWKSTISTRAEDPETSRRCVIAQRLHTNDLPAYLMDQGGWEVLCLPARYEETGRISSIGWVDPRKGKEGALLCPQRYNEKALEKLEKDLGPYQAAAQLQQRPVPKGGGLIKRDWLKFWFVLPKQFDQVVQSWDFALDAEDQDQTSSSTAYSVGQVWGKIDADHYLIDEERGQWDILGMLEAVERLTKKYPQARAKLVENKAAGKPVVKMLRRKISGFIFIEPKDYGGNKVSRANSCLPEIKSGNVFIPHPSLPGYEWMGEVEEAKDTSKHSWLNEVTLFPKHKYKDRVDTMTQYLNWVFQEQGGTNVAQIGVNAGENVRSIFQDWDSKNVISSPKAIRNLFG